MYCTDGENTWIGIGKLHAWHISLIHIYQKSTFKKHWLLYLSKKAIQAMLGIKFNTKLKGKKGWFLLVNLRLFFYSETGGKLKGPKYPNLILIIYIINRLKQ